MPDIDLYTQSPDQYDLLQELRPDYIEAIEACLTLASQYSRNGDIRLLDLCCGTGANSLKLSKMHPLTKVELVDINGEFLNMAASSGIVTQELSIVKEDVRHYRPIKEYNLVLSIFAYHHLPDRDKGAYIDRIAGALRQDGIVLLAEIFFRDKASEKSYYEHLIQAIPNDKRSHELTKFLEQTANSDDFEFKVPKSFADIQFRQRNFRLIEERKIWPQTKDENGTYVQVYSLMNKE